MAGEKRPAVVLTVGHSVRTIEAFLELLGAHNIKRLVDVRTIPRSRRNPQFDKETLAKALREADIDYRHRKALGGLRHARQDSPNTGWRNEGFRGFADYMLEPKFAEALKDLIEFAAEKRTAVMCAEAAPWHCHRSLIADVLLVHGIPVEHILSPSRTEPHHLTPFARVDGTRILYPGQPLLTELDS